MWFKTGKNPNKTALYIGEELNYPESNMVLEGKTAVKTPVHGNTHVQ